MGIWQEMDRQQAIRRERARRRRRRQAVVMFCAWTVLGALGMASGDPGSVVAGLLIGGVGVIGVGFTLHKIEREEPIEGDEDSRDGVGG